MIKLTPKQTLLLTLMVEEGCEVVHELCKAERFGPDDLCPVKGTSPMQRLRVELVDLWVVAAMLINDDADFITPTEFALNHEAIIASMQADTYSITELVGVLMVQTAKFDTAPDKDTLAQVKAAVMHVWGWVAVAMGMDSFIGLGEFRDLRIAKRASLQRTHTELFEVA